MVKVLVVYSSLFGANVDLAKKSAAKLQRHGAEVRVRGVKQVVLADQQIPAARLYPDAEAADLEWADGFVFTSPAHTGLLSAAMKAFVDNNHEVAVSGQFLNKTFTAMCTAAFAHAGQERVVDELNAIGSTWGCVIVAPSTANAELNSGDGNPWGLSFGLSHGDLEESAAVEHCLDLHLGRFVAVTRCLLPLIHAEEGAVQSPAKHATTVEHAPGYAGGNSGRYMIADILGGDSL